MRQAGQTKLGYYPIPELPLAQILAHLRMPAEHPEKVCVLDPCCGEGVALKAIRDYLGVSPPRTYGIELDEGRAKKSKELMPESKILGPASFLGTSITSYSFGLIYCNPPFDWELGGGKREEESFCDKAIRLLVPSGILVLVVPVTALRSRSFVRLLDSELEDMGLYAFPESDRKYKEVVVIGKKRSVPALDTDRFSGYLYSKNVTSTWRAEDPPLASDERTWVIPLSWAPTRFEKSAYLDHELYEDVQRSPLNVLTKPMPTITRARPPLPLNAGHRGLLLASGVCDGLVQPEGEDPHVVRGSTKKVDYVSAITEETEEDGSVKRKTVISQRPVLTVRAVKQDGVILTLSDEIVNHEEDEDQQHEESY